jgi:hypothetical protein
MSLLKILDLAHQTFTHTLRRRWLRSQSFGLLRLKLIHHDRVKDILETADDVTLDDLRGDVGNESLLRDL